MADIHVVDDEAMICLLINYVLKKCGHQVYSYRSAAEFLELKDQRRCDLVMTDFIMPQMDGLEFCKRLRQEPAMKDKPLIIMSGFEIAAQVSDFALAQYGVLAFLHKPFTIQALMSIVDRGLKTAPKTVPASEEALAEPPGASFKFGQRLQPRVQATLKIGYLVDDVPVTATTTDISAGGLFVSTTKPPAPFSPITFSVASASGSHAGLELEGTVAHIQNSEGGDQGFGISLQERNVHKFYAWYELVARLQGAGKASSSSYPATVRTALRVPLAAEAAVTWPGQASVVCPIGDVSAGGMRVVSRHRLPSQASLTVHFQLPGQDLPTEAEAEVRWSQSQGRDRLVYGLAFSGQAAERTAAISDYIDSCWMNEP